MVTRREAYQYWKGVSVGLILMSFIFTIPIIVTSTDFLPFKYTGLIFLIMNYLVGLISIFYALENKSKRKTK